MHRQKFDSVLKSTAELFRLLSHSDRIRLIGLLFNEEMDVGSLAKASRISHSSVSQHLKLMKMHGVVSERRVANHVYYSLKSLELQKLIMAAVAIGMQTKEQLMTDEVLLFQEMLSLWQG
jgi:DNA-binding transcriptional ArsR family regulator